MDDDDGDWICAKCTLKNHRIDKLCTVCLSPKEGKLPNLPQQLPMPDLSGIPREHLQSPWGAHDNQIIHPLGIIPREARQEQRPLAHINGGQEVEFMGAIGENVGPTSTEEFINKDDLLPLPGNSLSSVEMNNFELIDLEASDSDSSDSGMDLYDGTDEIETTPIDRQTSSKYANGQTNSNERNLDKLINKNFTQFTSSVGNNEEETMTPDTPLTITPQPFLNPNRVGNIQPQNQQSNETLPSSFVNITYPPMVPIPLPRTHDNERFVPPPPHVILPTPVPRRSSSTQLLQEIEMVPSDKWKCEFCTFHNRITAQYCETCLQPPSKRPMIDNNTPTSNVQNIPPPKIVRNNVLPVTIIEAASGSNGGTKAFISEWTCIRCSLLNSPNNNRCQVCDEPRPLGFHLDQGAAAAETSVPQHNHSILSSVQPSPANNMHSLNLPEASGRSNHFGSSEFSSLNSSEMESINMEQQRINEEHEINKTYQRIFSYCRSQKIEYVDSEFVPMAKNLWLPGSRNENTVAKWIRSRHIQGMLYDRCSRQPWVVFRDDPKPSDIQQGILGNCWFLSALAVLAEKPEFLRKVVITTEINDVGVYIVRLCKDGMWQSVVIDDVFPCDKDNILLFSQAKRRQLWVPLIEKAMAKLHGCYEALQAGRSIEGLYALTGAACESMQLSATYVESSCSWECSGMIVPMEDLNSAGGSDEAENQTIWVKLLSYREAGYLIGASCGGSHIQADENVYKKWGLRTRHAYSVLDVRNEMLRDGSQVKLVKLRNPWGALSWLGEWSYKSTVWQQETRLKNLLQVSSSVEDEGTFWISFRDFQTYFDSVDISKIRGPTWAEARVSGQFPNSAQMPPDTFLLRVFDTTNMDISVFLKGSRAQLDGDHNPVDMCICVFRTSDNATDDHAPLGPLIVSSRRQVKRHNQCEYMFEAGCYIVMCTGFNHWPSGFGMGAAGSSKNEDGLPKFVMVFHSSKAIAISKCKANDETLADAIIQLTLKQGDGKEVRDCATCYYLTKGWGGLIVVAENRDPERYMQVQCNCEDSRNVVSTRGVFTFKDSVPPLHRQVLINLTQLDGHSGYTVTHRLVHRLGSMGLGNWTTHSRNHDPELSPNVYNLHKPRPL